MNTYNQFRNLLPQEIDTKIRSSLEEGKIKVAQLLENDQKAIKDAHKKVIKKNTRINYTKFEQDPHYAIKKA